MITDFNPGEDQIVLTLSTQEAGPGGLADRLGVYKSGDNAIVTLSGYDKIVVLGAANTLSLEDIGISTY